MKGSAQGPGKVLLEAHLARLLHRLLHLKKGKTLKGKVVKMFSVRSVKESSLQLLYHSVVGKISQKLGANRLKNKVLKGLTKIIVDCSVINLSN